MRGGFGSRSYSLAIRSHISAVSRSPSVAARSRAVWGCSRKRVTLPRGGRSFYRGTRPPT